MNITIGRTLRTTEGQTHLLQFLHCAVLSFVFLAVLMVVVAYSVAVQVGPTGPDRHLC
jgi:hypothetical protein